MDERRGKVIAARFSVAEAQGGHALDEPGGGLGRGASGRLSFRRRFRRSSPTQLFQSLADNLSNQVWSQ